MDGSIEEVLAPLRLAVKEQVTLMTHNNKHYTVSPCHALH